jgi:uncharacterized protein
MHERHAYPPGVPCWVDTAQPDPQAAVDFYSHLFGWEFDEGTPSGAAGRYYVARLQGPAVAAVASAPASAAAAPVWATYVCVDSADQAAASVAAAAGTVLTEPVDVLDGGRTAAVADPAGAAFHLWQPAALSGAQAVNEPGTWNWSDLHTNDLAGATAFYGAVFGWEASHIPGVDDFAMFRLPGYGDFLARSDPDLRRARPRAVRPRASRTPSPGSCA